MPCRCRAPRNIASRLKALSCVCSQTLGYEPRVAVICQGRPWFGARPCSIKKINSAGYRRRAVTHARPCHDRLPTMRLCAPRVERAGEKPCPVIPDRPIGRRANAYPPIDRAPHPRISPACAVSGAERRARRPAGCSCWGFFGEARMISVIAGGHGTTALPKCPPAGRDAIVWVSRGGRCAVPRLRSGPSLQTAPPRARMRGGCPVSRPGSSRSVRPC